MGISNYESQKSRVFEQVEAISDKDRNGMSIEEWANIYRKVGLSPEYFMNSLYSMNPKSNLTLENLQDYLTQETQN